MISSTISPFMGPIEGRKFFSAISSISDKTFNTFFLLALALLSLL
jgi:hypothetical protein